MVALLLLCVVGMFAQLRQVSPLTMDRQKVEFHRDAGWVHTHTMAIPEDGFVSVGYQTSGGDTYSNNINNEPTTSILVRKFNNDGTVRWSLFFARTTRSVPVGWTQDTSSLTGDLFLLVKTDREGMFFGSACDILDLGGSCLFLAQISADLGKLKQHPCKLGVQIYSESSVSGWNVAQWDPDTEELLVHLEGKADDEDGQVPWQPMMLRVNPASGHLLDVQALPVRHTGVPGQEHPVAVAIHGSHLVVTGYTTNTLDCDPDSNLCTACYVAKLDKETLEVLWSKSIQLSVNEPITCQPSSVSVDPQTGHLAISGSFQMESGSQAFLRVLRATDGEPDCGLDFVHSSSEDGERSSVGLAAFMEGSRVLLSGAVRGSNGFIVDMHGSLWKSFRASDDEYQDNTFTLELSNTCAFVDMEMQPLFRGESNELAVTGNWAFVKVAEKSQVWLAAPQNFVDGERSTFLVITEPKFEASNVTEETAEATGGPGASGNSSSESNPWLYGLAGVGGGLLLVAAVVGSTMLLRKRHRFAAAPPKPTDTPHSPLHGAQRLASSAALNPSQSAAHHLVSPSSSRRMQSNQAPSLMRVADLERNMSGSRSKTLLQMEFTKESGSVNSPGNQGAKPATLMIPPALEAAMDPMTSVDLMSPVSDMRQDAALNSEDQVTPLPESDRVSPHPKPARPTSTNSWNLGI